MIIDKDLVVRAIDLTEAQAEVILNAAGTTWGPKWVEGQVDAPGLVTPPMRFRFGEKVEWKPAWGKEMDFVEAMERKYDLANRQHENTSVTALLRPWLIEDGEFMYAGAAYRDGIVAATSGAKGWADENISGILIGNIIMFAQLEADLRRERKQMRI